jgi:sialidase-1
MTHKPLLILLFAATVGLTACTATRNSSSSAAPKTFTVFEPIPGQYASMRIPALVLTKKNTLLAFCEGRIGTASDWADMDLLMRRSIDGGETWEPPVVIAARRNGQPTSNATPIVDDKGTVHLLYQRDYARAYYTRSTDDGKTWAEPVDITYAFEGFKTEYDWKVLAPGPGHGIQLKNGRLLAAVWMSDPAKLVPHRSHAPSCTATIYSDDFGKTWQRGAIVANNTPEFKNPNETMAIQLEDGRVMLNIRNVSEEHRRGVSYSPDGISNWTKPAFDEQLFEPICMASIVRIPAKKKSDKSRILFVNPDSRDIPKFPRKNLTAKLSYDEGKTWSVNKVLDAGPAGYSDLAVAADGTVYCLYETNTGKDWNYTLILKRFSADWRAGKGK